MMATFDRANHLFFILPVANNVVLFVVVFASWLDSFQLEGLVDAFLCLTDFFMESLILAQDERWRRA
ncbi:hypothetical protein FRC0432_02457 [Corynebacterium diphtheriae]|nr:hypothetical protein FRC0432_02457 [Corynebacterium diphtheriae]